MRRWIAAVILLVPGTAAGQGLADYDYENLTFRGIGFDYGYVWPTKVESTSAYSVRLDLGFLGPAVRISPSLTYWSSELESAELDRLAERLSNLPPLVDRGVTIEASDLGRVEWSDLALQLDAHIVWTTPIDVFTYVGAGVGVHAMNGRGEAIENTFVEDLLDSTTAGIALMAGVEFEPSARFRVYGEARYTLVSDVRYPGLRIGGALMLPSRTTEGG